MPKNHTVEVTRINNEWITRPVVSPGDTVFLRFEDQLDVTGVVVKLPPGSPDPKEVVEFVGTGVKNELQGTIKSANGGSIELDVQTSSSVSGGGSICIKTEPPPHP